MARIIEAEARVTAVDATGNTFEAIAAKVKTLSSTMRSLGSAASGGIANVNRTIGHLQRTIKTLSPIASGAAAAEGMRGLHGLIHETVKATVDSAHEAARMAAAGFTDREMAEAGKISQEISEKNRALSATTIMHSLRNLQSIVGTFDEAAKLIEPISQLRLVTLAAHPERKEELEAEFDKLEKSQEMVGATMDPARFRANMNLVAKAMNVFGDTLRPTDFYDFAKYSRQAGQGYDDSFLLGVGPTLMQEMAGKSAGEAMSSFYQQFVAGKMPQYAAQLMNKYGLIGDRSKVEYTNAGLIKRIEPGAVVGHELAKGDPNRWIREVFLPHLAAHGVTSRERIADVVASMSGKRTTGQAMGIFATQQARIDKDLANERRAKGLDAAQMFMNKDPLMAWQGVSEQFNNLLRTAGGPLAEPAARGLNAIASELVHLQHAASGHPWAAAAGLGVGTAALAGGSGLASIWTLRRLLGWGRPLARVAAAAAPDEGVAAGAAACAAAEALFARGGVAAAASGGGWLSGLLGPAALLPLSLEAYNAAGRAVIDNKGLNTFDKRMMLSGATDPTGSLATFQMLSAQKPAEVKGSADLNVTVQVEPSDNFISQIISAIENRINAFGGGAGHGVGTDGATGLSMPPAVPVP
jgi:hypothetical protein